MSIIKGMHREQFTLTASDIAWIKSGGDPVRPTLTVAFDGEADALRVRLFGDTDGPPAAEDVDLTVRLIRSADTGDAQAIVALAHRLTGDYILELTADPETVLTFSRAARRYGESGEGGPRFRVRVLADGEELVDYEKETLLVYGPDGELLRQHSLIPSGVEL